MQRVFVQDRDGKPLMPTHPARARRLLRQGRARVVRREPFVIRLLDRVRAASAVQPTALRLDPGARTTGIALVRSGQRGDRVVWAAELTHRSAAIRQALTERRQYRRARRSRKTRSRAPRFANRRRPNGWLPPSLRSRVDQTRTWAERLGAWAPVSGIAVETARFDVHALAAGRDLEGVAYQQGTLAGYELREYLLLRHAHACAYCAGHSGDPVLEVEHVQPRSRGGTDRLANLVIACRACNVAKGNRTAGEWAAALPRRRRLDRECRARAERIEAGRRPSLQGAAALNAGRYAVGEALKALGVPVTFASGGRTKANRAARGYPKAHWIDAACVGPGGDAVVLNPSAPVLGIEARGRGQRRVCRPDRYGFPRGAAGRVKRVSGLQTGDAARLDQPRGRYRGRHAGVIAGIRADGRMDLRTAQGEKITAPAERFTRLQRFDGYAYARAAA